MRRSIALILLLACPIVPGSGAWVLADEPEPEADKPAVPSRIKPGVFHLSFDQMYVGFEADMQWREVTTSLPRQRQSTRQQNRDFRFQETFGLSFSGDLIDPELLNFSGNFELGWAQTQYREELYGTGDSGSDSGLLTSFDLRLDLLRSKPISASAYARRNDNRIARRFLPSLREDVTEAGASVLAVTGSVTTEVGVGLRDVERTGNRLVEDDEDLRSSRFFVDSTWQISDDHRLKLYYEHQDEDFTYQGSTYDFSVIRDEFRAEHELRFGPEKKHTWDTFFRYSEETGQLARDEFQFTTRLALQHSEKLRTSFRYGYYGFEQSAIESDLHKFDVMANYQVTDALRVGVDAFFLRETVEDDLETDEYGGRFELGYLKPTGAGDLSVNFDIGFNRAESTGDIGARVVRDEAHALTDVRPVILRNTRVHTATILAHDATRTRYFVLGTDYFVVSSGGRTYIRRIPTGRIAMGDVVYFDYRYDVPSNSSIDTVRTDLLIEHRFTNGLTPYYYFEGRFQHVGDSLDGLLLRDNMSRHRTGVRYERDRWNAALEYEVFDDTVEPYDAFHLTGRRNLVQDFAHTLDLAGEVSRYNFSGGFDARDVWWVDMRITDRWQLNPYTSLRTSAAYRREDDSVDGVTNGVDLECVMAYTRNALSLELSFEYDLLSVIDNDDESFGVFIRLRRDLGHLLKPRGATR